MLRQLERYRRRSLALPMDLKTLICFALILGGVLLGCSNAARGDIIPSWKRAQVPPVPEFDAIHMIDREIGWAQNAGAVFLTNDWVFRDKAIWRTTNGGQSWTQVLCASPATTGTVSAFFLGSSKGHCITPTTAGPRGDR